MIKKCPHCEFEPITDQLICPNCGSELKENISKQIKEDHIKIGALINIFLKLIPIVASSSLFIAWPTAPLWFMVGLLYSRSDK